MSTTHKNEEIATASMASAHAEAQSTPRLMSSRPKIDFAVGGQAVIEGVMMRSPNFITVAVRKSQGNIKLKDETFRAMSARIKFFGIPIVRGVVNLFEMMVIGMRMLNFSGAEAMDEEASATMSSSGKATAASASLGEASTVAASTASTVAPTASTDKNTTATKLKTFLSFGISLVFALGMSLFLFKFLPLYLTDLLSKNFELLRTNYLVYNFIDGIIKMTFFITYIGLLGMTPSMHRVFQYHGAEHKSIYTYEKGLALNVENAKKMTRFHPRCGTSFILVVFLLSIFIYTFVPKHPIFWMNFLTRVAFLPIIAGVSYEILKWSAKHAEKPLVKLITLPGLLFQRITTQEPDESQLEVALSALRKALDLEEQRLEAVPVLGLSQTDVP